MSSTARDAASSATIVALEEQGRVRVRLGAGAGRTEEAPARLTQIAGYCAAEGDRVLVVRADDGLYVVAVIHAAHPPALVLPDGARAAVEGQALSLRDPEGRLLVRYAQGAAEIVAPEADLVLSAPEGRVVLRAGTDVAFEAARDVTQRAGRRVALGAGDQDAAQIEVEAEETRVVTERLEVEARASRLVTATAVMLARSVATTAEEVATKVERYELHATRIIEQAKDAFRDVSDLLQSRVGRARTIVEDSYALYTRRTVMASKDDTSIDGRKILLG